MLFMAIGSACSDPGLAAILAVVKKLLTIIQIIGPILAIISLAFHISMMVKDPEDKKRFPKIRNSAIALLILFFVPVIVNVVFGWMDNSTTLSSCWNNASSNTSSGGGSYISPYGNDENQNTNIFTNPDEYSKGVKKNKNDGKSSGGGSGVGDRQGSGNTSSNRVVFIGDSRTVQMYAYLNNNWAGANYSSGGVHEVGNDIYVSEGAMGLNWMKSTGIPAAQKYFTSGTAIVILMGVNDLSNANNYINYVNSNAESWKSNGSSLYFVSVNPCNGSYDHMNPKIKNFNSQLKSGLSSSVGWIDTYSEMYSVGFNTTDGLHYDKNTYQTIYNYIKSKV